MKTVKFTAACTAVYKSSLEIPEDIADDKEAVLEFIHNHLNDCPVDEIEWLSDLDPEDAVTLDDIIYISENVEE